MHSIRYYGNDKCLNWCRCTALNVFHEISSKQAHQLRKRYFKKEAAEGDQSESGKRYEQSHFLFLSENTDVKRRFLCCHII